jgi:hypothetical protein
MGFRRDCGVHIGRDLVNPGECPASAGNQQASSRIRCTRRKLCPAVRGIVDHRLFSLISTCLRLSSVNCEDPVSGGVDPSPLFSPLTRGGAKGGRHAQRASRRCTASGSLRQRHRQTATIVPDSLARPDRPDCQSASPDSSGQEQGGVDRSAHTVAIAPVVAGPGGPSGQTPFRYVSSSLRTYSEHLWHFSGRRSA